MYATSLNSYTRNYVTTSNSPLFNLADSGRSLLNHNRSAGICIVYKSNS